MARAAVAPRVYAVVFVGGCLGGGARLALDLAIPTGAWAWDIVAINVLGSALLGGVLGWFTTHRAPWWAPALGPGMLGGFTTFSAMAAPHPDAPLQGAGALVVTLIVATLAAALGWRSGAAAAARYSIPVRTADAETVEAEIEGFAGETAP